MDSNSDGKEEWSEEQWEKWLTHDIGLEEFEDPDLSEITEIRDEFGLRSSCNASEIKDHVMQASSSGLDKVEGGASSREQTTTPTDRSTYDRKTPAVDSALPVAMDTYRPKRPTTLNLFPHLPRTQDSLNNNSLAKKFSWQEKISQTSSPLKTGELMPSHEHFCLSDEEKSSAGARSRLKDCGTSTEVLTISCSSKTSVQTCRSTDTCERIRYQTDVRLEPTEEIYLTPVQRCTEALEPERSSAFTRAPAALSADSEAPPPYQSPIHEQMINSFREQEDELQPPPYSSLLAQEPDSIGEDLMGSGDLCYRDCGAGEAPHETSTRNSDTNGLSYDSAKYTLVFDEHDQLELVSLKECYHGYSDDSDAATVYDNCVSSPYESVLEDEDDEGRSRGGMKDEASGCPSESSTPDGPLSRKFVNVFMNGRSRSTSSESFGLFSCIINGEEREQTHQAVYRFVPRHEDELELDVNDPLLVEVEDEDYWYEGYNMRTGARGIFPAYYATEVFKEPEFTLKRVSYEWTDEFRLKFLGSVQVFHHKGNDVLCAAMQKIAVNRRLTLHYNPPSTCSLEVSVKGLKLTVHEDFKSSGQYSHFFHLKNVSFCGYHPKNRKYFGFITKHPADERFACHVFVSENSTKPLAQSIRKAFHFYYKEFVEVSCPTEDIYLE
nr:C-Jun-amino-terminal kinase-interacting protein 1 [Misgurnus anguillicaudatus]